jgi:hypothetical protein
MTEIEAVLIGGGSAVIGGLVSGFYQHVRDSYNRPKLHIDYRGDKISSELLSNVFIKVRVQNQGRLTAKGCRVFLASLTKVLPSEPRQPTVLLDSKQLAWAGGNFLPRDIPKGVNFYAELVNVSKLPEKKGWHFFIEPGLFGEQLEIESYLGTYHFSLVVTSDNAEPATCGVDVTYNGNSEHLSAAAARTILPRPRPP